MGYFFVKQYGESTSGNPLLHWIDEDYKLYDHRLHRWTQIFIEQRIKTDDTDFTNYKKEYLGLIVLE